MAGSVGDNLHPAIENGINQSFDLVQDKVRKLKYFSDMHLNIYKRTFMVIDIDKPYVNSFCTQLDDYHLVNFKDL